MKKLSIFALLLLCTGCASPAEQDSEAYRVLQENGMRDITMTGWRWLGCDSKNDVYSRGFAATGPSGMKVSGVVCGGIFKNWTVRFD